MSQEAGISATSAPGASLSQPTEFAAAAATAAPTPAAAPATAELAPATAKPVSAPVSHVNNSAPIVKATQLQIVNEKQEFT